MRYSGLVFTAAFVWFSPALHAQGGDVILLDEEMPAPVAPTTSVALEEIVVTAQRREESLQDTPVSVSAFDEEALRLQGIDGLADIQAKVPSLQADVFATSNSTLQLYIRGVGIIDSQVTQDPAVGVYIDGVYVARSSGLAFDVADLERVEVLRGPQGTLFGRNTTGGAVNFITKRPSVDGVSFTQDFTFGNYDLATVRTSMNLPLGDTLAARLAIQNSRESGFIDNTGPGEDFGDRDSFSGRFDLRWFPAENWTFDYSFDRSDVGLVNYMYQAVLTPESDKGVADLVKREAERQSVFSDTRLDSLASGAPMEESEVQIDGHSVVLQRAFEHFDLKYIGAYRDLYESFYVDLGGGAGSTSYRLDPNFYDGPAATALQGGPTPLNLPFVAQNQTSHEIQAIGNAWSGRLNYVAGLFWFQEEGVEDYRPTSHQFSAPINPTAPLLPDFLDELLVPLAIPRLVSFIDMLNEMENESFAAYTQLTWTPSILDERLDLSVGYRHTRDKRWARKSRETPTYIEVVLGGEGIAVPMGSASGTTFDNETGFKTFSDDSVSLIAQYALSNDWNVYAKYVEAYKSGGFNLRDPQIDGNSGEASDGNDYGYGFADGFDKEIVRSFEVGSKSVWFDRRVRLNADVFYTQYDDMQINFLLAGTLSDTKTTNAGEARLWGGEIDGSLLLGSRVRLDVSYAYLNAEISRVIDVNGNDVADQFQFNAAPENTLSVNVDVGILENDWGTVFVNAGYQFMDERNGGAIVGQPVQLREYELVSINLGILPRAQFLGTTPSIMFWARNLLDEEYEVSAINNLLHADRAVLWGQPRTYGVSVSLQFDG